MLFRNKYRTYWSEKLTELLDNHEIVLVSSCTAEFDNGVQVWLENGKSYYGRMYKPHNIYVTPYFFTQKRLERAVIKAIFEGKGDKEVLLKKEVYDI